MTPETSIYEYAKQSLECFSNKTALWFYGKGITYWELFDYIDNVADHLSVLGVRQGTTVTIYLPNCPQAVIAVYAIAKLGGICNIIHPLMPLDGVRQKMAFAESKFLIVGSQIPQANEIDFAERLIYADVSQFMDLPHKLGLRLKQHTSCPKTAVDFKKLLTPCKVPALIPDQPSLKDTCVCYLHSSGTTGLPKTVMHSHISCNNWVSNAKAFFQDRGLENEVVLSVLPMFHGSGLIMNVHQVICAGGTQVLMARWVPTDAIKAMSRHKITVLTGVPFIYQSILEQPAFRGETASRISQCYVSGDAVSLELKTEFDARVGHPVMYEGYGMTETITACFAISAYHYKINASGYPLVNCEAAVLTENDDIQRYGSGELVLSTNTMMLGYLKDTAATSECFIERDGKKWFRTGDYGSIDDEGYLYFLERIKNTIIRNGYNIYPVEIESLVRKVPLVKDVAVIGRKISGSKGEDICAFVVLADENMEHLAKKEIIKVSTEQLPRYSVPNVIVCVEEIPRNSIGKVDKNRLVKML